MIDHALPERRKLIDATNPHPANLLDSTPVVIAGIEIMIAEFLAGVNEQDRLRAQMRLALEAIYRGDLDEARFILAREIIT